MLLTPPKSALHSWRDRRDWKTSNNGWARKICLICIHSPRIKHVMFRPVCFAEPLMIKPCLELFLFSFVPDWLGQDVHDGHGLQPGRGPGRRGNLATVDTRDIPDHRRRAGDREAKQHSGARVQPRSAVHRSVPGHHQEPAQPPPRKPIADSTNSKFRVGSLTCFDGESVVMMESVSLLGLDKISIFLLSSFFFNPRFCLKEVTSSCRSMAVSPVS